MSKPKLLLIGGGGHCKSCIDVIEQENYFSIQGIIDLPEKIGQKVLNYEIIGCDDDLSKLCRSNKYFFITIGFIKSCEMRVKLFRLIKQFNIEIPVIISPTAYVSKYSKIGEGTIIMNQALVNVGAVIGQNCIINSKALIEHDVEIGDNCHISTGAIINGGARIGNKTFFGSNAVSKQYIEIPENSFINANSLIK